MYIKPPYAEDDLSVLHAHMKEWSFATLISRSNAGLHVSHLPFLLDAQRGSLGTLTTHLARANPHCDTLRTAAEVLVIFNGPHAFVSPSWYSEQRTFPTWNYAAIHAHVRLEWIDEPEAIREILARTVDTYDTPVGGSWTFGAMPEELIAPRLRAIAGVELTITRIEGKFKLNQDRSAADRHGVIAALQRQGTTQDRALAQLMAEREAALPVPNERLG
jgi:transcriptional regulator